MTVLRIDPIKIIKTLRESDKYIEQIYTEGGCYQFYKVLKELYPSAEPYINKDKNHVATLIDGQLYDITGYAKGIYFPLETKEDIKMCESWSFGANHYLYKECSNCGEPLPARGDKID